MFSPEPSDTSQTFRPQRLISVEAAEARPGETAFGVGYAALLMALTTIIFASGVLFIWIFSYTFWTIFEAMTRAFGWGRGFSAVAPLLEKIVPGGLFLGGPEGWPLDAAILCGVTATWGCLYFALDHLSMLGNQRAQIVLRRKALRCQKNDLPPTLFFVEARTLNALPRLVADIGYLLFYPDRLVFVGEAQYAVFPRTQFTGVPALRRSFAGMTGTAVLIDLASPGGVLRVMARDNADALSQTGADARLLQIALTEWLTPTIKE